MTKHILVCLLCTWIFPAHVFADNYPVDKRIDIKHYQFHIAFTDHSNEIEATAFVTVFIKQAGVKQLRLDLVSQSANTAKGMVVLSVSAAGNNITYTHANNALIISGAKAFTTGKAMVFKINYRGEPADGLHAGPTKYGDRSFFSDNWPNKARHWLPLIDHISDKATCEFIIKAPAHYKVVSNGLRLRETVINDSTRLTHWKQSVPVAPWLFTLGIADFAVQYVDRFKGKSIETWVYAKDSVAGFYDFAEPTKEALAFFTGYVGPFVYEKLANIQSPVVSGGMEAASAIGYSEKLVTGDRSVRTRNVIIHEVAHHWFGNAVTESTWDDAWLSEGFATCFTMLFIEHQYGKAAFLSEWQKAKESFIKYYNKDSTYHIVAGRTAEEEDVVNIVTYQKGACILLMLRDMIGEAAFKKGIQAYYRKYMNGHATTSNFQQQMEKASGQNLAVFFEQWLHRGDLIRLKASWSYDASRKQLLLTVNQLQHKDAVYTFPLELAIEVNGDNKPFQKKLHIHKQSQVFTFPVANKPTAVILDPRKVLLSMIEITGNE